METTTSHGVKDLGSGDVASRLETPIPCLVTLVIPITTYLPLTLTVRGAYPYIPVRDTRLPFTETSNLEVPLLEP